MAIDPRDKFGEYGGKPGSIQKKADGHVELEVGEKARILRTHAIRIPDAPAGGPSKPNQGIDPATGHPWVDDQQQSRLDLYKKTRDEILNGYTPEDVQ